MLGPVTISIWRVSDSRVSLAMKLSTWRSTTGWRPASISTSGSSVKSGAGVTERRRPLGEGGQQVELGERAGRNLQPRDVRAEVIEQLVVEQLLAGQRAVLCRERLVLERLQFWRDVALGVLERLAAAVIVRDFFGLRAGDFDIEAVHAVVLDLEVGDAGARPLAGLQLDQELAAVRLDRAQLIELGIKAVGNHAAFAQQRRRLGLDRGFQQCGQVVLGRKRSCELHDPLARERRESLAKLGQQPERLAQPGEVARAGGPQRDARSDAFDIGALPERFMKAAVRSRAIPADERFHRVESRGEHGAIAQRVMQRLA